ncbi:hypothetical protein BU23DRAFT_518131 [Bimuria novae-zelandiae CBS 107.79]|uniref:Zn(2)-C6 fungal-type domain-containing protein n=1 Tax=Bimuria novae-zelandiae CBS 107.79 TaxID=1447943 RepID=A0A6A5UND7_9PLEO|nr:hypothetical protein BU23DRAFT_518131 [Bimuria novae-zelandiae CBS 107.79]
MVKNSRATAAVEQTKAIDENESDSFSVKPEKRKGKKDHVRKKAWRPKTKTGCITCRIRRIKCDEAKPSCKRCTSTGRKCDGYTTSGLSGPALAVAYAPPQFLRNPSHALDLNSTQEQEAFHFFKNQTAYELSGFFDSVFWQFEVLQASHTIPAIRHAVIAIAALHRKFISGRMPVVPDDISDKQIAFAIEQSNRAIQELTRSSSQRTISDMMDVMTACIMFYCLCCFQGHQATALEHLRSGLKILHQLDQSFDNETDDMEVHPVSLKTLRAIFVTMDVQARGVMSKEMLETWAHRPKRNFNKPPRQFVTFSQARYAFEAVYHEMLGFMQALDVNPPSGPDAPRWLQGQYQQFQREFDALSIRLDEFLARLSQVTAQEDRESILGIKLFRAQIGIYLRLFKGFDAVKCSREIEWEVEEHDMILILDLACELLRAPPDISAPAGTRPEDYYPDTADPEYVTEAEIPAYARPVFSSNSGLLSALWLVVTKSRSSTLRRRAMALMLDFPRREGIWDGVVAGRVAWEILRLEETAVDGVLGVNPDQQAETIADCNKVRDCSIKYIGSRVMEVEFRSLTQWEARPAARGIKKILAW